MTALVRPELDFDKDDKRLLIAACEFNCQFRFAMFAFWPKVKLGIVKLATSSHEKDPSLKRQTLRMAAIIDAQPNGDRSLELRATETPWNEDTGRAFGRAFSINDGELSVLRASMLGQTFQELADARGRSINTVRTQSKSLFQKTIDQF